jgi:uncharacterized protein
MTDADHGFGVLETSDCWTLLAEATVGRLAWADPGGRIMIVPVNFGVDRHAVVLRTGTTVLLDAARARRRCGFQAESLEPGLRSGWTVLVDGILAEVTDEGEVERLGQLVDPWLRAPRPHVLRLESGEVTGRHLRAAGGVRVLESEDDWP